MLVSLIVYLKKLRSEASKYESIDINGENKYTGKEGLLIRFIFAVVSLSLIYCINNGFSDEFVSYFSSVLSILVGLFITALVFSFDKFYTAKDKSIKIFKINLDKLDKNDLPISETDYNVAFKEITDSNASQNLWDKQSYNYSMQFSYLTGYNIVTSIFLILLLALNTLFCDLGSIRVRDYHIVLSGISLNDLLTFLKMCLIITQRFFVLYLIFIVMYKTLFIVSSMVQYNVVKMKQ